MKYFLSITFFITGCAHPRADEWWPKDHYQMMKECRILCHSHVKGYSALDGACICHKR